MPTLMERQLDAAAGLSCSSGRSRSAASRSITKANTKAGRLGTGRVEGRRARRRHDHPGRRSSSWPRHPPQRGSGASEAGSRLSIAASWSTRTCSTSDPDIFALGECVEVGGHVYGLVAPLYEMARVVAAHLAGEQTAGFVQPTRRPSSRSPASTSFRSATSPTARIARRSCCATPTAGVYKRLVLRTTSIIGTVLYGETADGAWFNDLMKKRGRHLRHARDVDLRPGAIREAPRWTLRRPLQRCRMMRKSAAATACARARSSSAIKAKGLTTPRAGARPHQGVRLAAAPAPASSSR